MRKFFTLFATFVALSASTMAQEATTNPTDSLSVDTIAPTDSVEVTPRYNVAEIYSSSEYLEGAVAQGVSDGLVANPTNLNNRYKLYPTENMWNFLKLDTCTGCVWQVQFVVNGDNRMQSWFIFPQLKWDESWEPMDNIGRFELYPTQNMYNFLLMDKKNGRIWQIQWSIDPDNRGLIAEIE